MDKRENRTAIKYLQKRSMVPEVYHEDMVQAFFEDFPIYATVRTWVTAFKRRRDHTRSGRQKTSTADEQVDGIHHMVLDGRCLTIQQIATSIGINSGWLLAILTEISETSCPLHIITPYNYNGFRLVLL